MCSFSGYGIDLVYVPSLLVLIVASLLWLGKRSSPPLRLPPGPSSLPIIGNLHLLGPLPHRSLYNLSKSYGPIMRLRLGSVPLLVVSSSSMATEILRTHDTVFASRPSTAAGEYLGFGRTDMALAPYGSYWRCIRQLCKSSIFTNQGLEAFMPIRAAEVAIMVRSIYEDSTAGKKTHVLSKVLSALNNMTIRGLLGKPYADLVTSGQDSPQDLMSTLKEGLELAAAFNIGDYIPYLQWMDLQGYVKRMKIRRQQTQLVFQKIIDDRREQRKGDGSSPKLLIDVLLSASQENQWDVSITDDNITAVLLDMLAGGTDTSSVTVEWAIAQLLNNPATMGKLQAELDTVIGRERLMRESDMERLPYLRAVVKETMRLNPPAPLLLPRESMKACEVAGYDIAAKTQVFVNVWAIGRDESEWERPLEFRPERFMGSSIDVLGKHPQLLPFGAGRRACPGLFIGLRNVEMMLGTLVQGFSWSLPSSEEGVVDMREHFGVTTRMAFPLVAQATPRLPPHLYSQAIQQ